MNINNAKRLVRLQTMLKAAKKGDPILKDKIASLEESIKDVLEEIEEERKRR